MTKLELTQKKLINLLESQIVDLTMMSKIELGDDVIIEIQRLKAAAIDDEIRNQYPANIEGSGEFNKATLSFAQEAISDARLIIESFDPSPAMTIGFDKDSYTLTAKEMLCIARSLYLADCELHDFLQIHKQI